VQINATINAPALSGLVIQNIDHDSPYNVIFDHSAKGEVATEVFFNMSVTDRWGNPIDNRRGNHDINLHIHGPAPDDCNFVGYGHDLNKPLDLNGNLSVKVKLTSKRGSNKYFNGYLWQYQ